MTCPSFAPTEFFNKSLLPDQVYPPTNLLTATHPLYSAAPYPRPDYHLAGFLFPSTSTEYLTKYEYPLVGKIATRALPTIRYVFFCGGNPRVFNVLLLWLKCHPSATTFISRLIEHLWGLWLDCTAGPSRETSLPGDPLSMRLCWAAWTRSPWTRLLQTMTIRNAETPGKSGEEQALFFTLEYDCLPSKQRLLRNEKRQIVAGWLSLRSSNGRLSYPHQPKRDATGARLRPAPDRSVRLPL